MGLASAGWMIAFDSTPARFHFSFGLRPALQFAGAHAMTLLIAFGAGVAAGQIVVLLILVPAVALLVRLLGERAQRRSPIACGWPCRVALMVDRGTLLEPVSISMAGGHSGTAAGELGDRGHWLRWRLSGACG